MSDNTPDLTKTGVYLHLFHGRAEPDQSLDDWGEQGPILGPFEYAHVTYGEEINLGDDGESLKLVGGLVYYGEVYYGDFSVISAAKFAASGELQSRHEPIDRTKTFPGGQ